MSDGDAFEFNNTINGDGAQINQGKNVTATQTNQYGDTVTFGQFVAAIKTELEQHEDCAKVEQEILAPLQEIAAQPEPETEEEKATLKTRISGYLAALGPYVPYIRKAVAAFADGALRSMGPPAGWIVGGLLEVIRDHRQ